MINILFRFSVATPHAELSLEFNSDYMDYYFPNPKHNIQRKLNSRIVDIFYSHRRVFIFVT